MEMIQILFFVSCLFIGNENVLGHDDTSMTYHVSAQDTGRHYLETRGDHRFLKKHMLSPEFTCNDGSPAGFYLRKSNYSKLWIVFLEEGWCCFDKKSCDERWSRAEYLMSSKEWPETRTVGGILSNSAIENPYWWQANHVFVPYCTSDIWTGRRSEPLPGSRFNFMGSIVLKQVIRELLTMGLANANSLVLSGSSAGGVGVMLNVDPIQKMLKRYSGMSVHGISDSGWFMEQKKPFVFMQEKKNNTDLSPIEAVQRGIPYWHSQIPSKCRSLYADQPFNCFIGYKIYPTLGVPVFIFQWLFDEFQLRYEVGVPVSKQHWDHVHKMGDRVRKTLVNVTGVFAPSCVAHTVLTSRDWRTIKIGETSLPQVLHCWQLETRLAKMNKSKLSRGGGGRGPGTAVVPAADVATRQRANNVIGNKKRKNKRRDNHNKYGRTFGVEMPFKGGRRYGKKKRHQKMHNVCAHQNFQKCTWPQCNKSCPKLRNPVTGEVIEFVELLQAFGLNISNLSSELGLDLEQMSQMEEEELMNLLTQLH